MTAKLTTNWNYIGSYGYYDVKGRLQCDEDDFSVRITCFAVSSSREYVKLSCS